MEIKKITFILSVYLSFFNIAIGQIDGEIVISFDGPVHFLVTDSIGRRTGLDLRTGTEYAEIPNTTYGREGLSSIDDSSDFGYDIIVFSAIERITDSSFKANYSFEIIGTGTGIFAGSGFLSQTLFSGKGIEINTKGVIDSFQSVFYRMRYTTDTTVLPTFVKLLNVQVLRQDLENCFKLNLIRGQSLYADLMAKVNRVDTALVANDTVSVRFNLLQFDIQIDSTANDTLQLSPDGYQILKEDVMQMFSDLPPHVVPSTPVPKYNVILNTIGNGSILKSPDHALYDSSTTVQLTANPSTGYRFSSWSGDASGTVTPISVVMNSNQTITATFEVNTHTIIASTDTTKGNISPKDTVVVNHGASQRFTFTPNLGYKVDSIIVDGVKIDSTVGYTFINVTANHTIRVTFKIDRVLSVPAKFATIQSAVNFARLRDTIAVSPGTYNEIPDLSGKDSLVVIAVGGVDQVTVQGFALGIPKNVTIKGFVIDATGTGTDGISTNWDGGSPNPAIVTIEGCEIKNSVGNGIAITVRTVKFRIVNNRIHDNTSNGISIGNAVVYIINNTIVKNGNGVTSNYNDYVYLVNNIISYNTDYGVYRNPPPPSGGAQAIGPKSITPQPCLTCIKLLNNLITGNNGTVVSTIPKSSKDIRNYTQVLDASDNSNWTTAGNEGTGIAGSFNGAFTDVFVSLSPIDLHLKSVAFPINRGVNSWSPLDAQAGAIPTMDFEGTIRPQGGTVDMGADEY